VIAAAIVLCGGFSRRMGCSKAELPWGDRTLLEAVVERVGQAVPEVILVAREGQELALPSGFAVARDAAEGRGPLAGLVAGMEATKADRVFLAACDSPFIEPALIERLLYLSRGRDAAVPVIGGHYMVTTAVYTRAALPIARELIAADRLRPRFMLERLNTRIVTPSEMRAVDPELRSFRGCNTPEEYAAALHEAGLD